MQWKYIILVFDFSILYKNVARGCGQGQMY